MMKIGDIVVLNAPHSKLYRDSGRAITGKIIDREYDLYLVKFFDGREVWVHQSEVRAIIVPDDTFSST